LLAPLGRIGVLIDLAHAFIGPEVPDREAVLAILDCVARSAKDAMTLAQDVLAVEALDQDRLGAAPASSADVGQAVHEAVKNQSEALPWAACDVVVKQAPDSAALVGAWRREPLVRMFSHLLRNAAGRAMGGPATVDLSRQDGWLRVRFTEGASFEGSPSIAPEQVGDSVRRLGEAQRRNGLGLWILCQTVVGDLGGEIQVQSDTGSGAQFDIRLPLGPVPPAAAIAPVTPG
jgi:signal transduction histidine kinase